MKEDCGCTNPNLCDHGKLYWLIKPDSLGVPTTPSPARARRDFPSFVREPGIGLPPDSGAKVPTEKQALAALRRYREHSTPEDNALVQRWIAAAKEDKIEHARRIRCTR